MNKKQDITSVIYNIVFYRKNSKDIPLINIKSKSGIEYIKVNKK